MRPLNADELSTIVGEADAEQRTLALRGGRTHERFQNLGDPTDLELDLTGLDGIVDYSPVDLTLAVEAGVRLATVDQLLAEQGQRIALDVPHRGSATFGGTFACGLSGPRRLRYGALKDMVIGAEVINREGFTTKSGGMVVKNVSGYELARLHYGAHGAFGIVSRLNLKVLPTVESRAEVAATYTTAEAAAEAGAAVLVSTLDPAAVYIVRSAPGQWVLRAQIEGSLQFARVQLQAVGQSLGAPENVEYVGIGGYSTPDFDRVVELREADTLVARVSVPASRQAEALAALDALESATLLADMGSGLVYVRSKDIGPAVASLKALGWPTAYLALPGESADDVDVFGPMDEAGLAVLRRLKDQFDPQRMFNPGRFVAFL